MKRSVKYEINSIITTVIVFAIVAFVLLIAAKHPYQFDLTKHKKYTFSDQTVKLLKGLNVPVKALAFYSKGAPQEAAAKNILERYHVISPKFTYEFVDPDKNPMMAKKYDITMSGVIVLDSDGKNEKVRTPEEESITNGLVKVTKAGKKIVYFVTGHGELSLDEMKERGISTFKASLEKEVYVVSALDFIKEKKVPDEASMVVICGPRKPYFKEELNYIKTYLDKGGRVFVLLGSESPKELSAFLLHYGIRVDNDLIVDEVSQMFGGSYLIPAIMQYGTHPIVDGFKLVCFFPMSRSIQVEKQKPAGSDIAELAFSSQKSWAETDMAMIEQGKAKFDNRTDRKGPCCLAAAGTYKIAGSPSTPTPAPSPGDTKKPDEKKARLVVFGSAQVADNAYISQSGNRDLLLNACGWLSEEESLISIRPREESGTPLALTPGDMRFIFFFAVIFLPVLIIITGIWVKIRRG